MTTGISIGKAIGKALEESAAVQAITRDIFPVATDEALKPYVCYARTAMQPTATKQPRGVDESTVEVRCYADTYAESVELAEAVREALEGYRGEAGGLALRVMGMTNAAEGYTADGYVQALTFRVRS